jgi:hypothetical protein
MERVEAYRKVCESVNYIWPNRNFVIVCARPKTISRNANGRLHRTDGKAIEYPDGWGLYFLNGVRFDEELYMKVMSGKMPFEDILAIKDIDQRTQAMRFGDVDSFIVHAKGEMIDETYKERKDGTHIRYALYRFPAGDVFAKEAHYAIYDDLVPGTGKRYMSGVPKMGRVADAMAWKFSDRWHETTPEAWMAMRPGEEMN